MKASKFLSLNFQDILKGFVVSIIAPFLYGLIGYLDAGTIPTMAEIKPMAIIALSAGLSYLLKNWLTNNQGQILKKEPKNT